MEEDGVVVHISSDTVRLILAHHTLKPWREHAWLAMHPRFVCQFPPVHCSWINQGEQWFSVLHRKPLRIVAFANRAALSAQLLWYIAHRNARAHPFQWSTK